MIQTLFTSFASPGLESQMELSTFLKPAPAPVLSLNCYLLEGMYVIVTFYKHTASSPYLC